MPEGHTEFINFSRPEEFSSIVDVIYEHIMQEYNEIIVDITISDVGVIRAYTLGEKGVGNIYELTFTHGSIKSELTTIWVIGD
jgi:hypothetical protein